MRSAILNYYQSLQEQADLTELVSGCKPQALIEQITQMLEEPDEDVVNRTLVLVRDLVLRAPLDGISQSYRDSMESKVVPRLEILVENDNWFIRSEAIYTLGKIGSTGSLPVLHKAFWTLRDRDPLILHRLMFEISWLEDNKHGALISDLIDSMSYTTRWSALDFLGPLDTETDEEFELKESRFARLLIDSNQYVRSEAEHLYKQRKVRLASMTKSERRKKLKELNRQEPSVTFHRVKTTFLNRLSREKNTSYSISDLEDFIKDLAI